MTKGEKPKLPTDPKQSARFISTAKELQITDTLDEFERTLGAIAPVKSVQKSKARKKPKG